MCVRTGPIAGSRAAAIEHGNDGGAPQGRVACDVAVEHVVEVDVAPVIADEHLAVVLAASAMTREVEEHLKGRAQDL